MVCSVSNLINLRNFFSAERKYGLVFFNLFFIQPPNTVGTVCTKGNQYSFSIH